MGKVFWVLAVLAAWIVGGFMYLNSSLVPHVGSTTEYGFWGGFVNSAWLAWTFVYSWFHHDVQLYQSVNNGFCYNLGFIFGLGTFASLTKV